jgi:anti-sigma factor RsiW
MDCIETKRLLEPYVDGELELIPLLDLEAHLGTCSTCKKGTRSAINFRYSIHMNTLFYRAPPELKAKIRAALRRESKPEIPWLSPFRRAAVRAAAAISVCLVGIWAWMAASHGRDQQLITEAISDHSRSLLVDHLLDVTSSEQYVVERWFTGKLDYSPPVVDLTETSYKLVGGRLDTLENRRVAAIVYKHQDCSINLFVWPVAKHAIDFDTQFLLGFHLCGWSKSGLNYLIVSELNQSDMEHFEDQLRERTE